MKGAIMSQFKEFIAKDKNVFIGLEDSKKSWKLCVRADKIIIHETSMPAKYHVRRNVDTGSHFLE